MNLAGKLYLVSGSTDGIGLHTAQRLAQAGAGVLVHGRSDARVAAAVARVREAAARPADAAVHGLTADLSSQAGVRDLASQVRARHPGGLTCLIHNAGVFATRRTTTADGLELTVSAASAIDWGNLQQERGFSSHDAYSLSKLCNILFSNQLAARLRATGSQVTSNSLDPGTVNTKMLHAGWGSIGMRVEDADDEFMLATSPAYAGVSGAYFVGGRRSHLRAAEDADAQLRLFRLLEEQTGCPFPLGPALAGTASGRPRAAAGVGSQQGSEEQQRLPHRVMILLWRRAAMVGLSAPALSLALPRAAEAAGAGPAVQLGGSGPPSSSGGGGGGGGGGEPVPRGPREALQLAAASGRPIMLTLVSAYSRIIRLFSHDYEERTGRSVRFRLRRAERRGAEGPRGGRATRGAERSALRNCEAFGGSGTQARAVIDGLPAEIAALALPLDVLKIEEAGLIRHGWQSKFSNSSVVVESVVSIVVRKGNPKGIRGWDDLAREDVQVIVANPKTAGVARWIFLALWGHRMAKGTNAAKEYVTKVFDRVEIQPRDAREASDVFYHQGFGDALLTYENEAVFTNLVVPERARLPFFSPDNNVRVREAATDFVGFLYTPEAQREFAACGFRSPVRELARDSTLPPVKQLWTVEQRLGPWKDVQRRFFDDGGILSDIQRDVSTRKLQQRLAAAGRR
eukprot:scaffold20.g7787.t1